MQIDYQSPHQWLKLNRFIADKLGVKKEVSEVRIYKELSQALLEITWGLVQLFPHKPHVYFFENMNPYFDFPMKKLKLENVKVKALDLKVFEKKGDALDSLDVLGSEDLFLLYSEDDPLLGKRFLLQNLEKKLSEEASSQKKIFRISVSHNAHYYSEFYSNSSLEIEPYCIRIHSFGSKGALSFLGSRSRRIKSLLASEFFWGREDYEDMEGELKKCRKRSEAQEKKKILNFEATKVSDFKAFFSLEDNSRVYDRAVIYWEDMDGYAFIYKLSKKLGFNLLPPGFETRLETTSLSRWGGLNTMNWLEAYGLTSNQRRGLVIIDSSLIDEKLPQIISGVREDILSLQEG